MGNKEAQREAQDLWQRELLSPQHGKVMLMPHIATYHFGENQEDRKKSKTITEHAPKT